MESILTIGDIRKRVSDVLSGYPVRYCILFGSYARGEATPESDVDLVLETEVSGFAYHGLWNRLEESLGKRVDLLRPGQVKAYAPLAENVRKDGKVIYDSMTGNAKDITQRSRDKKTKSTILMRKAVEPKAKERGC